MSKESGMLFDYPEQKRAYDIFCDGLKSMETESLVKKLEELKQNSTSELYVRAVEWELSQRATSCPSVMRAPALEISMQKFVEITPTRKLLLCSRNWSVVIWFDLEEVNFWFWSWLFPGKEAQYNYGFFRRLTFWLHECWGIGWDIRKRWCSEYHIRIFYLQLCIEFEQSKTNERVDNGKFSE